MALFNNQSLYNTLRELEVIPKNQLDNALEESKQGNIPLENLLLQKDLISDENLGKTISYLISVPLVRLGEISIADDILKIIPEEVARKQKIIAFNQNDKGLYIATSNPENIQIKDFIEKRVNMPVHVYYATNQDNTNCQPD